MQRMHNAKSAIGTLRERMLFVSAPSFANVVPTRHYAEASAAEDNIPSIWDMYDSQKTRRRQSPLSGLHRVMVRKRQNQKPLSLESVTPTLDVSINELLSLTRTIRPDLLDKKVPVGIDVQFRLPRTIQVNALRGSVTLPHSVTQDAQERSLAIVAEDTRRPDVGALGEKVKYFVDERRLPLFVEEIAQGQVVLDHLLISPGLFRSLMRIPRVGSVLGPRGLMPSERRGTVTNDFESAVAVAFGSTDWAASKDELVSLDIGNVAMTPKQIKENILALLVSMNERVRISRAQTEANAAFSSNPYIKQVACRTVPGLPFRLSVGEVLV